MLINFSPVSIPIPNPYLSHDEVEILREMEKLNWEEKLYSKVEEDMICNHL